MSRRSRDTWDPHPGTTQRQEVVWVGAVRTPAVPAPVEEEREKEKKKKRQKQGEVHEHHERVSVRIAKGHQQQESSLSVPYKEHTEANTKVWDLNQKTMQALDRLANLYATFRDKSANVESETAEGDILFC